MRTETEIEPNAEAKEEAEASSGAEAKVTKCKPGHERKEIRDLGLWGKPKRHLTNFSGFDRPGNRDSGRSDNRTTVEYISGLAWRAGTPKRPPSGFPLTVVPASRSQIDIWLDALEDGNIFAGPRVCAECREDIPGDGEDHILIHVQRDHAGPDIAHAHPFKTYCGRCWKELAEVPGEEGKTGDRPEWLKSLRPNEHRAYELWKSGLTQSEIAGKIGKSQQTVSLWLKGFEAKERAEILRHERHE